MSFLSFETQELWKDNTLLIHSRHIFLEVSVPTRNMSGWNPIWRQPEILYIGSGWDWGVSSRTVSG